MAYTVTTSSGEILVINDNTINTDTSLKLIGRYRANYGESIAENFYHLMENFASATPPANAVIGQLWYDTVNESMLVLSTNGWEAMAQVNWADIVNKPETFPPGEHGHIVSEVLGAEPGTITISTVNNAEEVVGGVHTHEIVLSPADIGAEEQLTFVGSGVTRSGNTVTIAGGADPLPTNITIAQSSDSVSVGSSSGTDGLITAASSSQAGVMTSTDKNNLTTLMNGSISAGTNITISGTWPNYTINSTGGGGDPLPTNISINRNATTVTVESSSGDDGTIPSATTTLAGVMTAADKSKLDGIVSYTGGSGIDISGSEITVDDTVVRTSGNQTVGGIKTFSSMVNAPSFNTTSDSRLKDSIKVSTFVDWVGKIEKYTWDWSSDAYTSGADEGVLYDEVKDIYPSAVSVDDNGYGTVNHGKLALLMVIDLAKKLRG